MEALIAVAIALFAGLMMTRLFKKTGFHFPDVTAFLLAGLLVGPYGIGRLQIPGLGFSSFEQVDAFHLLNEAALGFIAFSIGSEFRMEEMKHVGKKAVIIGITQAVIATVLVDVVMIALHMILGEEVLPLPVAITLGAIAAATAPAATLMVVRQYKAEGPLTRLLLPIVALDDAVGLMIFALSFGIAQALEGGSINVIGVVAEPLVEIVCSIVLGAIMGLLLSDMEKLFYSNTNRLNMTISFVFLTIALSSFSFQAGKITIAFSSLLVCMMAGTVFCNKGVNTEDIFNRCDKWTSPLYAVFFVLSGASLDLGVFRQGSIVLIGVIYVLVRALGKYAGALLSSTWTDCDSLVRKYLGIALFPQAGVALGMVLSAQALGGNSAVLIRNVILFSVLIYELAGPSMTKWALGKAGEIAVIPKEKTTHDRFRNKKYH